MFSGLRFPHASTQRVWGITKREITGLKNYMASFHVNTSYKEALWCLIGVTSCIFVVYETNPPQCLFSTALRYENRN